MTWRFSKIVGSQNPVSTVIFSQVSSLKIPGPWATPGGLPTCRLDLEALHHLDLERTHHGIMHQDAGSLELSGFVLLEEAAEVPEFYWLYLAMEKNGVRLLYIAKHTRTTNSCSKRPGFSIRYHDGFFGGCSQVSTNAN